MHGATSAWAIGGLARYITKWTPECDRRLERLMNYVRSTLEYRQVGWVGDDIGKVNMDLYADANYGNGGGKTRLVCSSMWRDHTHAFPSRDSAWVRTP